MIDGLLVINLDPPYAAFRTERDVEHWKDCTTDELRDFLIAIEALSPDQTWPPREYVLRVFGKFDAKTLAILGICIEQQIELIPSLVSSR